MVAPGAAVAIAAARSKLWGRMTFWFPPNGGGINGAAVVVGAAPGVALSADWVGCGLFAEVFSAFGLRLTSRTNKTTPTRIAPAIIRIRGLNGARAAVTSRTGLPEPSMRSLSVRFGSTTVATFAAAPQPAHPGVV